MKPTEKSNDELLQRLISELRKTGTICGTGSEIDAIRAIRKKL
jgi:hypothetical protein